MKIIFASDLHYGNLAEIEGTGPFTQSEHQKFAAEIHSHKPDVLVVAGDCGETCIAEEHLADFCQTYKNPHGASLCIPGNHDLWIHPNDKKDHFEKYDWFFKVVKRHGWIGLRDTPWKKDGVYIAGNMGWYDFSSADPMFSLTPEQWDKWGPWSDYSRMHMKSALEVNKKQMAELKMSLSKVPLERKALIVVTHFIGFSRLMADGFRRPDVGSAFMGNYEIGKFVADMDSDIFYCGHSHRRKEFQLGKTRCINNGSGYGVGSKRFDIIELSLEVKNADS
jgi:predicted phosphodiesterase